MLSERGWLRVWVSKPHGEELIVVPSKLSLPPPILLQQGKQQESTAERMVSGWVGESQKPRSSHCEPPTQGGWVGGLCKVRNASLLQEWNHETLLPELGDPALSVLSPRLCRYNRELTSLGRAEGGACGATQEQCPQVHFC